MEINTIGWKLFRRREVLIPTWRGWLCILIVLAGFGLTGLLTIHPFLSVNQPEPKGVLVVEGWLPDYALEKAIARFRQGGYEMVFTTGCPMDLGGPLANYKTYPELSAAILKKMGLEPEFVQPVPAPRVKQDRTYTSGVALRRWFELHDTYPQQVTVITEGPHARRSRLLFQKALGKQTKVGIIALEPEDYEPRYWWRSSQGVRVVGSEALAYGYARFLFWPRSPGEAQTPAPSGSATRTVAEPAR